MADVADLGSVPGMKRRSVAGKRSSQSRQKRSGTPRVTLEKILGISTASGSGLASDPNTGLIAYPAGCVIVLLHPKTNKQTHIINTSRKPFSALAFSHDGKHLVTGESGHMPCVRVWDVDGLQVAEVQSHKYGVSCVAFSSNSSYIVSVGFQHDMTVSVWDWKKGSIIASNKVSSRVLAVSFSQDNSYFVTAGHRHVKFWYLDASKERRVNSTVPLIGRSGLLGDHKNSVFCGVACGRGLMASNTYCITSSGLLCVFSSSNRQLQAWVDLKASSASCLSLSQDLIFCGCSDGLLRVFNPSDLHYISTLQRPHRLGVDLTQVQRSGASPVRPGAQFPDSLALSFDPASKLLTCVYSDHSVYVWDVRDLKNPRRLSSALYHSGCVWSVEVYPESSGVSEPCLPPSSFLTCSSDNTIRLWNVDHPNTHTNLYSKDLLRILYAGDTAGDGGEKGEAAGADGKAGIRVLSISPDGKHLAAGERSGNLRIFSLEFLDEILKIEAHDSEILCLEFSPLFTGVKLLASASRDRLIHVFNVEKNYSLEQTLNDHSASITAVKFTGEGSGVCMVSCGADKSLYIQTAEQNSEGLRFSRSHHVVEKTTLYDMDRDSSRSRVAVACQDRNVRVYNVESGKLKKSLKGSSSDEGALLKVQMDPSGCFFATSCSDKNISVFDYESGECVATLFGHSEIVTSMRFSPDCRRLITASGDGCVFVWRLDPQMTSVMKRRLNVGANAAPKARNPPNIRRETFVMVPSSHILPTPEEEEEAGTPGRADSAPEAELLQTNGKLPLWFRKLQEQGGASSSVIQPDLEPRQVRPRWAEQTNPLTICPHLPPSPIQRNEDEEEGEEEEEEDFQPQSLESLLVDEEEEGEEEKEELNAAAGDRSNFILNPDNCSAADREFDVEEAPKSQQSVTQLGAEPVWRTQLSPDSACSEGSAGSADAPQDADSDSLSQGSSVGSLCLEEDEDRNSLKNHFDTLASGPADERFDTDLRTVQPVEQNHMLNTRLSISTRFLSRFQDRLRVWPTRAPPLSSVPARITEESNPGNTLVASECSADVSSAGSSQTESKDGGKDGDVTSRPLMSRSAVASLAQQGAPQPGYLEPTASSRAKLSRDSSSTSSSVLEEDKENQTSSSSSDVLLQNQTSSLQEKAPPTPVMSLSGATRWSVSSVEVTPTNQNQTLIQSPAPLAPPTSTAEITSSTSTKQEKSSEDSSTPLTSSSPMSERLRPSPTGAGDEEEPSLQECQQAADELKRSAGRAVLLYQKLCVSPDVSSPGVQKSSILLEAFDSLSSELQALLRLSGAPCGQRQDDGTRFLLEKYSELLVQMTRGKLNRV